MFFFNCTLVDFLGNLLKSLVSIAFIRKPRYQKQLFDARILRKIAKTRALNPAKSLSNFRRTFVHSKANVPRDSLGSAIANCSTSTAFTDRCNRCPPRDKRARALSAHLAHDFARYKGRIEDDDIRRGKRAALWRSNDTSPFSGDGEFSSATPHRDYLTRLDLT